LLFDGKLSGITSSLTVIVSGKAFFNFFLLAWFNGGSSLSVLKLEI